MMSYTAAARLREICITQGEAEASAVGRRAESKDEPAEPQSGRAQTAPFLDAGGTQELLSLAQEQHLVILEATQIVFLSKLIL